MSAPGDYICGGSGITPEAEAELERFREHMRAHPKGTVAPDCRFCVERAAKLASPSTPEGS